MMRLEFPGRWYTDALPSGEYAALVSGVGIDTHWGSLPLPDGENVLFVRLTNVGGFQVAGQGHSTGAAWLWRDGTWTRGAPACGVSPVIFDLAGALHVSDCSIGSQGWRYVAHDGTPAGHLVTGDQSYGPFNNLFEYSEAGGFYIGQAAYDGGGVQVWDGTALRQLERGDCRFVRVQWAGQLLSVAFVTPHGSIVYQLTFDELRTLPLVPQPEPPKPDPEPEPEPPDPEPEPPDPEPEPEPDPPYPLINEADMQTEQGWMIGPGDKVVSVDAAGHVTFTTSDLTEADLLEATPQPNDARGRCAVRPVAHATIALGADATKHTPTGNVCAQLYGKTATDTELGHYELWAFGQWPSGVVEAVIEYIEQGADHGRSWHAAGLTWVRRA